MPIININSPLKLAEGSNNLSSLFLVIIILGFLILLLDRLKPIKQAHCKRMLTQLCFQTFIEIVGAKMIGQINSNILSFEYYFFWYLDQEINLQFQYDNKLFHRPHLCCFFQFLYQTYDVLALGGALLSGVDPIRVTRRQYINIFKISRLSILCVVEHL